MAVNDIVGNASVDPEDEFKTLASEFCGVSRVFTVIFVNVESGANFCEADDRSRYRSISAIISAVLLETAGVSSVDGRGETELERGLRGDFVTSFVVFDFEHV